jgi:hypothetical protein
LTISFLTGQLSFGSPAAGAALQHMTVMQKSIEHGGNRGGVSQKFSPVIDGPVRC